MEIIGILLFLLSLVFCGISGKSFAYEKKAKGWIALIVVVILGVLFAVIITTIPENLKNFLLTDMN